MESDEQPPTKKPEEDDEGSTHQRRASAPKPDQESFAPETLASLAIQILSLRGLDLPNTGLKGLPLSNSYYDYEFQDALKRAELLLKATSGRSESIVHAYQLFDEHSEPMTFEDVVRRFKEVGWKNLSSRGPVESVIRTIYSRASEVIDLQIRDFERVISRKAGEAFTVENLRAEFLSSLDAAFSETRLGSFFPYHESIVNKLTEYAIYLLLNDPVIDAPNIRWGRLEPMFGYFTFRSYVWPSGNETGRFRPFELFLHAAQAGIEPEKLIRSNLRTRFIPSPPCATSRPSVLWYHKGAEPVDPEYEEAKKADSARLRIGCEDLPGQSSD